MERHIFKPSRETLALALILSVGLLGLLIYLTVYIAAINPNLFTGVGKISFLGLTGLLILFFIFCVYVTIRQITSERSSLILSKAGVYNGSDLFCQTFISWEEIENVCSITSPQTASIYLIVIHLKNPIAYLQGCSGILKRWLLKKRYKKYGSPIVISYLTTDANLFELQSLLAEGLNNSNGSFETN